MDDGLRCRLLAALLAVVVGGTTATAQVLLYHGGGHIDHGYGEKGQILTSYVLFQPSVVQPYAGNRLTKVRIGMTGSAKNVTLYLKEKPRDSRPLYTQSIGTLSEGWNEVTLTTPFAITGKKNIAIGFKATIEEEGAIGYSKEKEADGDFIYVNQTSQWTSTGGTLCLQAYVEGESMPQNELAMGAMNDQTAAYDAESTTFVGTVRNMGVNLVERYGLKYRIDDGEEQEMTIETPLEVNAVDTFAIEVPSREVGTHAVKVWVASVNDEEDTYAANNSATAHLTVRDIRFARRVVCEENTGLWCGWCPRGMVGMELMKERHPGQFIAICVHGGDVLEIDRQETYNYGKFTDSQSGAPSCTVNRRLGGDPYYDIENLYNIETLVENHLAYTMTAHWNADSTAITTLSHFFADMDIDDAQYYAAFVVTEDSVTGYAQTNYYAQTPGQPFYGWESKEGHTTDCYFNDLARGIFSNYDGDPCSPATMTAETVYDYPYTLPLPPTVTDKRQVHVVGLLIDHKSGYVVNAFQTSPEAEHEEATGIAYPQPLPEGKGEGNQAEGRGEGNRLAKGQRYNLNGQRVDSHYRGIVVSNGRKILMK